ncbi:hypothetical protein AaE_009397, partial [Aphanomyces astaci]
RLHTPPPAAKPAQAVVPRVVLSETELSSAVHDERRRLHTMKSAHLHDPTKFRRASIVQESVIDSSFVEFSTDVLLDPVTLKMMTEFCSSIPHAAERLMFWADVQHLRTLPSAQYTDKMLRKIYEKFLSPHAATPICVPTDMIRGIQDEFDRPGGIQSAENLLFHMEVEEAKRLPNQSYVHASARKVYETYLKPNAKKFVALPPHIHEAFAAKVDADQLDSVAFTDVQYFVLDYVRTELWHDFSVYPPYVARIHESALTPRHWDNYIPNVSAADMTAVLAKLDKMDPAECYLANYAKRMMVMTSNMYRSILAKALTLPMDQLANVALAHKIHRDTLLLLLHDKIAHRIFKKFLASRMKDHFVVFVDEVRSFRGYKKKNKESSDGRVDEFINLPGIEFMQHTAKKLFKKYLSEHAKLQVDMSTKMRQDIQAKLNTPSIDMFKSAIVKVKTGLLQDSLVRYLKSPIHSEMKQEFPDLVRNLMSAVDKGKVDLPQLESILSNPTYLTNFRKYLKTQHAAENLIFLEEVEEFRRLPSYEIVVRSAKKILDKYININTARSPIPIAAHLHDDMVENVDKAGKRYFSDAIQDVVSILRTTEVHDFLESPLFMQLIGSWVVLDETYAIRQLIGEVELAYFKHVVPLTKSVRQGQSGAPS